MVQGQNLWTAGRLKTWDVQGGHVNSQGPRTGREQVPHSKQMRGRPGDIVKIIASEQF